MAPRPDGGLFLSIGAGSVPGGTVLASLDAAGRLWRGWPIVLAGYSGCEIVADPNDGSARAVCAGARPGTRAFAYDDAGRQLAGWPADLPGNLDDYHRERPRIVDGQLYVALHSWDPPSVTLVRVSRDGSVRAGATLHGPDFGRLGAWEIGNSNVTIGPDGTVYVMAYSPDYSATEISAADLEGLLPGWPIRINGFASAPSVGPDGRVLVAVGLPGGSSSQVLAFASDGRAVPGWPVELPVAAPWEWDGAGDAPPAAPAVASDGSAYVVTEEGDWRADGTTAYAVDAAGNIRAGWPYRASTGLVWLGECGCGVTGCGRWRSDPVAAPDGSLYLLHLAASAGTGGSIVAVGTDGVVKAGWPVVLRRAGAEFLSVAVGPDGTAFALAIEPEVYLPDECGGTDSLDSATILAISPDGTVRYRTTIVSP